MKRVLALIGIAAALLQSAAAQQRPRLLVLTDIGGDPDDQQSMRRLMLYSNEFEIAGLIASASGTPGELGRAVTRPELIEEIVRDYAAVRDKLTKHAPGYPAADSLRPVIKSGSQRRGIPDLGAGHSTEGSEYIIASVDASDAPLYVAIWGGAHDLAQALSDVRQRRGAKEAAAFVAKLRVYAIADQDGFGGRRGTGEWIREQFPEMRYVEAGPPGMNSFTALFRGMYQNDSKGGDHPELPLVRSEVIALTQQAWVERNVRTGHGPLGAGYPLVKQNPGSERNTAGVKEGDTPSWFFVLPNGLNDPERPEHGGWGGRFQHDSGGHYIDAEDAYRSGTTDNAARRKWTVARWREAYQNDFAARMDWCSADRFTDANHNPVVALNGDRSRRPVRLTVKAGKLVTLSAAGTKDPDGNALTYTWFVYPEAGTYGGPLALDASGSRVRFTAPKVDQPRSLHILCEVTDDGEPRLTSYRRAIVEVRPSN